MIVPQAVGFFLLMYVSSFFIVMGCNDWFLVWLGLEINMISFISLIFKYSMINVESCMKYFFIQSLGSALFMMMFYLNFSYMTYLGVVVLTYKLGGGPFYFWFPSVCSGIEWGSCFMLMTFQKLLPLLIISIMVSLVIWVLSIISLLVGAMGSFNQKSLKRLLAFSSIHHIGWMLMIDLYNYSAWFLYLLMYSIMLFSVVISLLKFEVLSLDNLKGMSNKWIFVLMMMSMGGMPPFVGFFLKWWMFYNFMMLSKFLLMLMIMMSVVMFYVYLRIIFYVVTDMVNEKSWVKFLSLKEKMSGVMFFIMSSILGPMLFLMY